MVFPNKSVPLHDPVNAEKYLSDSDLVFKVLLLKERYQFLVVLVVLVVLQFYHRVYLEK
jgi:hypothetical protein